VREEYYPEFNRLYRNYGEDDGDLPLIRRVRNVIDRAANAAELEGLPLRPDARLFMLVNLHQLVVLPMTEGPEQVKPDDLFPRLDADVRRLLLLLREEFREHAAVSSHAVLAALATHWSTFHFSGLNVWGD
jgi:hypothetical protein